MEICIKLKIVKVDTNCGLRQIIAIICFTYVQQEFSIRTLMKQLLKNYQIFTKMPQISHIHKNRHF